MKILKARVNWMVRWSNEPSLEILVDQLPNYDSLRWQEIARGLYYTEQEGYVGKYYYLQPGEGYGGRKFTITMTSGEEKTLIGPWSSSSLAVTAAGFPCLEVAITADPSVFEHGHTFYAGTITLEAARQAVMLIPNTQLLTLHIKYGTKFVPALIHNPCPGHWIYRTGNGRCEWCGHKVYTHTAIVGESKTLPPYLLEAAGEQLEAIFA